MPNVCLDQRGERKAALRHSFLLVGLCLFSSLAYATSIIPISDRELSSRAELVVHGIVVSNEMREDRWGRPETVTTVQPLAVVKGALSGDLVLHQTGGVLPDGRFFSLWGRPEYQTGREVVVFAIANPDGDYQTAEMVLGKFDVLQDEKGTRFALPALTTGVYPGVHVLRASRLEESGAAATEDEPSNDPSSSPPRELARFLSLVRTGFASAGSSVGEPAGTLSPVVHPERGRITPLWGDIGDILYRWNNSATAAWTLAGTVNITGGGIAEAQAALASWTDNPNSNINYTQGSGTSNVMHLNATSSTLGCGWSTCLSGGGVIGCGGPNGAGSNSSRGETYWTITSGTVELRAYCALNGFDSITTQSVLTHELGHTLGLGHSDQNVSPHDVCRGDENAATMRSMAQHRTTLGTDDQDAIRWLYGDGGNSCTGGPLTVTSLTTNVASPQSPGTTITWTATTTGGTAPVQYRFWRSDNGGPWILVQDYGTGRTYSWTPVSGDSGPHKITVWARNAGSTSDWDAYLRSPDFTIVGPPPPPPLTVTSLTTNVASPQSPGTTITWTATTTGGTTPVQYRFWRSDNSGPWILVQDYSTGRTYSWTPVSGDSGPHKITVWVRNAGSTSDWDAYLRSPDFTIVGPPPPPPLTVTSLTTNVASPKSPGITITWTATTTGGTAPVQYRFWRSDNGGPWILVQDYGTGRTYSWTPVSGDSGPHKITVWVRNAGSTSDWDAYLRSPDFTIVGPPPPPPLTVTSLTTNVASPQSPGTTITWTATTTGGTAPVQYRFWRSDNSGPWILVQDYGTRNTYTWTPVSADSGPHMITVWVRNAGSTSDWDAYLRSPNFTITGPPPPPPLTVTSLTTNVASPQSPGTTITWTAATTGGTAPVQYRFWRSDNGGPWILVQDYGTRNTYTWTPVSADSGLHMITVWVRNAGSTNDWDAYLRSPAFTITP